MRALIQAVVPLVLIGVAGCGGRTSLGFGIDGGPGDGAAPRFDGKRLDLERPRVDVALTRRDRIILPDTWCLPVPAGKVQGTYGGAWSGTWSCSGTATTISGELKLALSPAGAPAAFAVKGSMTGSISYGVPFSGAVSGTMGCNGLAATMDIVVGSGGLMYELTGSMQGTFSGSVPSFSGDWKAYDPATGCSASGSWKASRS